ncbi:CRISPR-associated endonuclease Cas1 [Thiocystis violacea]|uniref:CRISPR-associated endonuclease Cas1 n=1 Tax=Thiocystis violacea TaxID=13725 RepID=UPI0019055697|nr:CRISPR-associated endonuclease Cas1 [Thiocystis violacea]MBK1717847.1 CRISPR-associated endonuclease Cas1 [Thiocystis violacea]
MDALYLASPVTLKRHENTILVVLEDGRKTRFPVESLKHIIAAHDVRFNGALLGLLKKHDVRVTVLDYYGHVTCTVEPAGEPSSGAVHLKQAAAILDPERRLAVGKSIIAAALRSLAANLRYHAYRGCEEIKPTIGEIDGFVDQVKRTEDIQALMGWEGQARLSYYAAWEHINPALALRRRTRRPPGDRINCLLSFLNGLVYALCLNEIRKSQLDPTLSFIHSPQQSRHSLSLDLAELFKPILADRVLFTLVNRSELKDVHFDETPGACLLSEQGRKHVLTAFSKRIDGDLSGERTYRQRILEEVFALQAGLLGVREYVPFTLKV